MLGDADGVDIGCLGIRIGQSLDCDRELRRNDLFRVMFDPTGMGEDLIELLLRDGANRALLIK